MDTVEKVKTQPKLFFDKSVELSEAQWALTIVEMNPDDNPRYGVACKIVEYDNLFYVVPK